MSAEEYKTFLNEHTAWYRPSNPEKVLLWQQQIEVKVGNRKTSRGLKSKIAKELNNLGCKILGDKKIKKNFYQKM